MQNLRTPANRSLERVFRLAAAVNKFQLGCASLWLRLPRPVVVEMIDNTIDLVGYSGDWAASLVHGQRFEPVVLFACVDPNAVFFTQWLRGSFHQRLVRGKLMHCEGFVGQVVKFVLQLPRLTLAPAQRLGQGAEDRGGKGQGSASLKVNLRLLKNVKNLYLTVVSWWFLLP
jgi:hypothetical protein